MVQTAIVGTSRRALTRMSGLLLSGTTSTLRNLVEELQRDSIHRLGQVSVRSASASPSASTSPWTSSRGFKSGCTLLSSGKEEGGKAPSATSPEEGKTGKFNLIQPEDRLVQIHACLPNGFLIGDRTVEGSVIAVGDLWLRWKPREFSEITMESLVLVDVVTPVPDILVIGCGGGIRQMDPGLMRCLQDRFLGVEALDTNNAVSTFNILNAEGRSVVGAFLVSGS